MINRGAVALLRVAKRRCLRLQRDIAIDLGFDEPRISRLLNGKIKPNRLEAVKLRDEYGIDPALWDQEPSDAETAEAMHGLREREMPPKTGTGGD